MISVEYIIDLTRPITAEIAMWPGTPQPSFDIGATVEKDGFYARRMHLWEHTGTHVDAPAHFIQGGATVESISIERLVCPAVVIDVAERCDGRPDYAVTVQDVTRFEAAHGQVASGSAVLFRTGWDAYGNDHERYMGPPGDLHFPGVGEEAALLLVEERGVIGIGIDTLGIDPGNVTQFSVHRHATLPHGVWNLEGLVHLEQLPPVGALLITAVLPLVGGSASPARVLALIG
jgi:kynurenine formamidase